VRHDAYSMMWSTIRSFPAPAMAGMLRWNPSKNRGLTSPTQSNGAQTASGGGTAPPSIH
jgi:hypothetical protein